MQVKDILNNIKRLNKLVKVSPAEPSPKSDIWFRKGENLLNLLDCIFISNRSTASVVSKNKNEITIKGTAGTFKYVDLRFFLKAGTYTIQRKWELISGTKSNYTGLVSINDITTDSPIDLGYIAQAGTSKTFTIDHDAQIRLYLYLSADTSLSDETQARFYDMQIVKGSAEREFKEYAEPEIYVKNNNNEYILFKEDKSINVTTGVEYETGRIINGKKEYAKTISSGVLPSTAGNLEIPTGLNNINLVKIEGKAISGTIISTIPFIYTGQPSIYHYYQPVRNVVVIRVTDNASNYTASETIYYTKN